jgi:NAD(P)-dependent dehydrogenase (short-subunit alcohol dehydrogenase family)
MEWLPDCAAVVTGAGSGIGAAVVRRFVAEGARVVAFDRSGERLDGVRAELGDAVVPVVGDVRSFADNERAVAAAVERFGGLDVFVGNAGVWDGKRSLTEMSADEIVAGFDEVFAINVRGYLLGAKASAPALARSRGAMIFTLSTSSYYVGGGGPIYVAAKHAGLGIVRALAHEFAPEIRVNGVAPSGTPTNMADAASLARTAPATGGARPAPGGRSSNLLEVAVRPEDHAGSYVLLASKHARVITGTVIHSDGGRGVMGGVRREGKDV